MGRTIMGAVVSLDGYIAYDDDSVGPLFDWYGNGDVEWKISERQEYPTLTTQASKDFMLDVYPDIGAVVIGRRVFDTTDGWDGVPAAGDHVFVVTHSAPTNWKHTGTAPFTFVTNGIEAAIAQAREFAGPDRIVDVAAGQIGGQALRLGLIDQVVMNVVPVVLGSGRPFFGAMGPGDTINLSNPSRVAQGDRVTHMLFDVQGTIPRESESDQPAATSAQTTASRSIDLFAGVPVADYPAALAWYERLFGGKPDFFPNDTEAVWKLAENRWVVVEHLSERAGNAIHTVFVDDFDGLVAEIGKRGIQPAKQETYSNGVRKAIYRDPEGNEIGFGGAESS